MASKRDFIYPQQELLSAEDRLFILLTYNKLAIEEKEQAENLFSQINSWESFYELALFNKLVPHLYHNLKKEGYWKYLPPAIQAKFEHRAEEIRIKNSDRLATAKSILQVFNDKGIPFVVLKGVLFSETIYQNIGYKRMNDIDLLIRKEDLSSIINIYNEAGLFCIGERIGGKPEKQLKTSHHLPPYVHKNLKCMFGTQWGLKSPLAPYEIDYAAIWQRVQPFSFMGLKALQLCPEDNLHHVCIHLGYYKTSVRDVFDIYNLLRQYQNTFNWALFLQEVRKAGTEGPVFFALSLANRLWPSVKVEEVIRLVHPKAKPFFRKGVREKTRLLRVQLRIGSHYLGEIEKLISGFNATSQFSEKLKYFFSLWKSLLWPPLQEGKKINAILNPSPLQKIWIRIKSPFRLMQAIANEIGWILLFALMIKTVFDVVFCGIRSLWKKGEGTSLEDYAQSLGMKVEDLVKLKESIQ